MKKERDSMEFESFDKVEHIIRINEEINSYSINNISSTITKKLIDI
jgi:predicted nucleic acid-binding OB-fold protein